jgi:hypothetical protein
MMAGQALGGIFPALVNILVISLQVGYVKTTLKSRHYDIVFIKYGMFKNQNNFAQ